MEHNGYGMNIYDNMLQALRPLMHYINRRRCREGKVKMHGPWDATQDGAQFPHITNSILSPDAHELGFLDMLS
jgi:hypothetical protein